MVLEAGGALGGGYYLGGGGVSSYYRYYFGGELLLTPICYYWFPMVLIGFYLGDLSMFRLGARLRTRELFSR